MGGREIKDIYRMKGGREKLQKLYVDKLKPHREARTRERNLRLGLPPNVSIAQLANIQPNLLKCTMPWEVGRSAEVGQSLARAALLRQATAMGPVRALVAGWWMFNHVTKCLNVLN